MAEEPARDSEQRGASRRTFLASAAGITGVAVASGAWLSPAGAAPAASGPISQLLGSARPPGGYVDLSLDGAEAGSPLSAYGGDAYADVVDDAGASVVGAAATVSRKHLAGVKYEDFAITVGTGMSKGFYDWIKASFDGAPQRKNGSVVAADFDRSTRAVRDFTNALITEVGFPALDAAAKDAAKMSIKFKPETTRLKAGSGKLNPTNPKQQKPWLPSNFRLSIDGIDTTHVTKVDAFTWKQDIIESGGGDKPAATLEPAKIEIPNLKVTLSDQFAHDFWAWHEDFVIKGNNSEDQERGGSLAFLSTDQKTVLFTLTFSNLGIFKIGETPEESADGIRRTTAEMYCENVAFTYDNIGF